jgi:hypothetical protein
MTNEELRDKYIDWLAHPDNDDDTDGMFVGQVGAEHAQLKEVKLLYPDIPQKALDKRRQAYAAQLKAVDKALFEKAKSGDAKAADLVYRRFENWSPRIADENAKISGAGRTKTFAELIAEGE